MKVVQILPELNAGGVEGHVLELAEFLASQGHESIVISNGGQMAERLEQRGVRHVTIPVHRKSLRSLFQVRKVRKFLRSEKPDVVHAHSRVPAWIAWLALRSMDRLTRPKFVTTVHGFYSVSAYSAIMIQGDRIIAVSESVREYIYRNYPNTDPKRIEVIPHGIDPKTYHPEFKPSADWLAQWQSEHPELANKQLLLLPGRITRLKGHGDFFQLIKKLKQAGQPVCGLIAGNTHPKKQAYLQELQQQANDLGIANDIVFLGHRSDLRELMAVSDIVMALSQQPESFGLTVLEALSLGKAVVGYDCGGVGELLAALFPAGRVPPGSSNELFLTTTQVLKNHSFPASKTRFTLEKSLASTADIYECVAKDLRSQTIPQPSAPPAFP
jgi:glycosyltransferase involved in cell wall biosynthesis